MNLIGSRFSTRLLRSRALERSSRVYKSCISLLHQTTQYGMLQTHLQAGQSYCTFDFTPAKLAVDGHYALDHVCIQIQYQHRH